MNEKTAREQWLCEMTLEPHVFLLFREENSVERVWRACINWWQVNPARYQYRKATFEP